MPGTPERGRPETLLAFDYGRRRIGVAVGQTVTGSATAVGTAGNGAGGPDWTLLEKWIREWRPDRLIVGLPSHADGSPSDLGEEARRFGLELGRFGIPVSMVDERYSSIEAEARLRDERTRGRRGRIRKEQVDAAAAALIAERWLAENCRNIGGHCG
ncbi:MAG: Holliday junction resolvase RuvX [Gammaproteobacteria bacterium]|nr:Holliday junction resolvase RuvX [Gammaproteobacteria bacterium]MDH4255839.1 Holliday junction resolvase RuvX [Gammaproteobacteria bacterium]MDH5309307.1 Holliday junction resolvase RuvX [Gammaproteobacteria bacterium]